ncbi:MAG: response regulator [Gemmatimonadetes bacterium]|nr:response regulator [Gemmatimonadota bacterium]
MTAADRTPNAAEAARPVVLLVDDDDDVARVFARALEQQEMVVQRARGGTEAVAMIQGTQRFAAAIVDLILPGTGGLEVVRALRARHPDCRIVAVTGLDEPAVRAAFAGAGADAFLAKPVDLDAMMKAIGVAG